MIQAELYHGTTQRFERFDVSLGNQYSYCGPAVYLTSDEDDAREFYASPTSPDLQCRIDTLADTFDDLSVSEAYDKARSILVGETSYILRCRAKVKNTAIMHPHHNAENTVIKLWTYDEETEECEYTTDCQIIENFFSNYLTPAWSFENDEIELYELRRAINTLYNDDRTPGELFQELLKQLGYDSVLMRGIADFFPMYSGWSVSHLIVFNADDVEIIDRETVEF